MPAAKLFWNERLEAMAGVLQSPKPSTPPPSQTGDAWGGGAGRERTGATSTKGCTGWWIALREGRLRDQKLHLPRGPRASRPTRRRRRFTPRSTSATRRPRRRSRTARPRAGGATGRGSTRSSEDALSVVGLVACGTGVGVGRCRRGDLGGGTTRRCKARAQRGRASCGLPRGRTLVRRWVWTRGGSSCCGCTVPASKAKGAAMTGPPPCSTRRSTRTA
ncbi:hypothetical protein DFJ73DRAFT_853271, partial [Zopfochytrium polystomum]